VAALVLTIRHEIHGPPALAGAFVAAVMLSGMNDENRWTKGGKVS
jgi:hypothetical protein